MEPRDVGVDTPRQAPLRRYHWLDDQQTAEREVEPEPRVAARNVVEPEEAPESDDGNDAEILDEERAERGVHEAHGAAGRGARLTRIFHVPCN